MNSLFPAICSNAIEESKEFYVSLLGFKPVFAIEYPSALASQKDAIRKARAKGYVPYTTSPRLDLLAPVWQDVLKA